jgi:parvulin-like peptidyl-prolyl isomerase
MRERLLAIAKHRLAHFVAVGALLAALAPARRDARDLSIDRARATRELRARATESDQREALRGLVEEEVLAREAERLGLGGADAEVRARLAQVMVAHIEAATPVPEPTAAELDDYISTHRAELSAPRARLRLLFFAGGDAAPRAERALSWLRAHPDAAADLESLARSVASDPSAVPRERWWTQDELSRAAGDRLAAHAARAPVDAWSGPVASAWGLYVVRVVARDDGDAGDVMRRAREALRADRRRDAVARVVARLSASYRVTVDVPPGAPTWSPRAVTSARAEVD